MFFIPLAVCRFLPFPDLHANGVILFSMMKRIPWRNQNIWRDIPVGKSKTDLDLEWEKRTLCSDGNCIGVIGADGRCRECGKPYEGDLPETSAFEGQAPDENEEGGEQTESVPESPVEASVHSPENPDPEWENRRLCSDGNCIGVIGADGRCKECGKPFEG